MNEKKITAQRAGRVKTLFQTVQKLFPPPLRLLWRLGHDWDMTLSVILSNLNRKFGPTAFVKCLPFLAGF